MSSKYNVKFYEIFQNALCKIKDQKVNLKMCTYEYEQRLIRIMKMYSNEKMNVENCKNA